MARFQQPQPNFRSFLEQLDEFEAHLMETANHAGAHCAGDRFADGTPLAPRDGDLIDIAMRLGELIRSAHDLQKSVLVAVSLRTMKREDYEHLAQRKVENP